MLNIKNLYEYCQRNNLLSQYRIVIYDSTQLLSWSSEKQNFPLNYHEYSYKPLEYVNGEWLYVCRVQYGQRVCCGAILLDKIKQSNIFNKQFCIKIHPLNSLGMEIPLYKGLILNLNNAYSAGFTGMRGEMQPRLKFFNCIDIYLGAGLTYKIEHKSNKNT